MNSVIKEADIPTTDLKPFTQALLVRPGERDSGVPVWAPNLMASFYSASAPAKVFVSRTLLVEVDDPDDQQTIDRVRKALTEQRRL